MFHDAVGSHENRRVILVEPFFCPLLVSCLLYLLAKVTMTNFK